MPITSWTVRNFKSFGNSGPLEADGITLLYGTNSSGKSSLMQALLLLRQSLDDVGVEVSGSLEYRGVDVDLGGYATVIREHDMALPLHLSVALDGMRIDGPGFFSAVEVEFSFGSVDGGGTQLLSTNFHIPSGEIKIEQTPDGLKVNPKGAKLMVNSFAEHYEALRLRNKKLPDFDERDSTWLRGVVARTPFQGNGWFPRWSPEVVGNGRPGRPIGGGLDSPRNMIFQIFVDYWSIFCELVRYELYFSLRDLIYIGPLRVFPQRVSVEAYRGVGAGARGERTMLHLARNPELVRDVNECFETLGIGYKLRVDNAAIAGASGVLGDVAVGVLEDSRTGLAVSTADVGFGISQVLPVIVHLMGNFDSTILIEQPEIHLHPMMQARLADIMIESVKNRKNRLVVETHSENILYRIQRRVREGAYDLSDGLQVKYVSNDSGMSTLRDMRMNEHASLIEPWPNGFMAEHLGDLFGEL